MEDSYISRRDKIVASAIELIGDLGLHALTPKNLARKQNISDTLIYKYFGGIDEVLIAVVNEYAAFDVNIQRTVERLDGTYLDKIKYYADTYATYYVRTLISVDFPAPFSPISAWISPFRSVKSTWERARTPVKFLLMSRISKTIFCSIFFPPFPYFSLIFPVFERKRGVAHKIHLIWILFHAPGSFLIIRFSWKFQFTDN